MFHKGAQCRTSKEDIARFDLEVEDWNRSGNKAYIRPRYEGLCWEVMRTSEKFYRGGLSLVEARKLKTEMWGI